MTAEPGAVARGVAELEDYLLRQTEADNAQRDAASFAAELPWLTPAQRKQVIRLYVRDRTVLARRTQELIEAALTRREAEASAAYAILQRRLCVTASTLIGALTLTVCLLVLSLLV